MILTDVGSTKADIHRAVRAAGLQKNFIGGHPMAGSERIGYRNSKSGLLENAYYILTPEPEAATGETRLRRRRDQPCAPCHLGESCKSCQRK